MFFKKLSILFLIVFLLSQINYINARGWLLNPVGENEYHAVEITGIEDIRHIGIDLNIHGQVVGYTRGRIGGLHAYYQGFLWSESDGIEYIQHSKAAVARSINDYGNIVGDSFYHPYSTGNAFFIEDGELNIICDYGHASAINNNNNIAGKCRHSSRILWNYSENDWKMQMEDPNDNYFYIRDINENNYLVGSFQSQAFVASILYNGEMTSIGVLPGDHHSMPRSINNHNEVVGWSRIVSRGGDYAFIWDEESGIRKLLSDGNFANAYGLNDNSIAVGSMGPSTGVHNRKAVMWEDEETIYDLNDLVNNLPSSITLRYAIAINNNNQILAYSNCNITDFPGIPGDFNRDYVVNTLDFAILAKHWLKEDCDSDECNMVDMTGSGDVNIGDLSIFLNNWLTNLNNYEN